MTTAYPVLEFNQFGGHTDDDRLLMFAPQAQHLAAWAGIPRKGWRIRMLFQRWVSQGRERELTQFWQRARGPEGAAHIVVPTAIVVAIQGEPVMEDDKIVLDYVSPIEGVVSEADRLRILAEKIAPQLRSRLVEEGEKAVLDKFIAAGAPPQLPDVNHNYVLEFALQVHQMLRDTDEFIAINNIASDELPSLIESMEALVRPALVVDGQHRLVGAAHFSDVSLPVVAISRADWSQQIYQFVVINEKAQKVETELLNDIFASSLTPREQSLMRKQFSDVRVEIEERIAGVLAGRTPESPFYGMITVNLPDPPESERGAYISQATIQCLIRGGRGAMGWRTDDEFYQHYIAPRFPHRDEWQAWKDGRWREYWFAFWWAVRNHYTPRAKKVKGQVFEIWDPSAITNLTKGVGLKILQRFFMEEMIAKMKEIPKGRPHLVKHLGEEKADEAIHTDLAEAAIPGDLDTFTTQVDEFLSELTVRFFLGNWATGLDQSEGHANLLSQMRDARSRDNWRASGGGVFVPA